MADLKPRNMTFIKQKHPEIYEAIADLVKSHNYISQQVNASPVGETPAPLQPAKLTVTAGGGFGRAHIEDNSPAFRGKEWFLEVAPRDPSSPNSFQNPMKYHLGATTSHYFALPHGTYHARAYSAQSTSPASDAVYHYDIDATGSSAPTVEGNTPGGDGYGAQPWTTVLPPIRA